MPKSILQARKWIVLATLGAVLATGIVAPAPLHAQDPPAPTVPVAVASEGADTVIRLDLAPPGMTGSAAAATASAERSLPLKRFGGYDLPLEFVTLQLPWGISPSIEIQQLTAEVLDQPPVPRGPELPPVLDWEPDPAVSAPPASLPEAPAFVVRSGLLRGQNVAIVAISPIFVENGAAKIASQLTIRIPNALPVGEGQLGAVLAAAAEQGAAATVEAVAVPINLAARNGGYRITVAQPGIQEVPYSRLGLASAPANVKLQIDNRVVAVEKAGDRLRFYAPAVGDRWNATSIYWLTLEEGSKEMAARGDVPPGPPKVAYEEGKWQQNRQYEAGYRGADGDHWFHAKLSAPAALAPGVSISQTIPVTLSVRTTLPLRSGTAVFDVISTDVTEYGDCNQQPFQFFVQGTAPKNVGGAPVQEVLDTQIVSSNLVPGCRKQTTSTAVYSTSQIIQDLALRLNPNGVRNTAVLLEAVSWRRPVELNFAGAAGGGAFATDAGAGSYTLTKLPPAWQLYDVTNPDAPLKVAGGSGGSYTLHQAAAAAGSRYILANLGMARQPDVRSQAPIQFGNVRGANAIYIGPAAFADELAPLLALRQQQGFQPLFVDVQAIYDVYGFGRISAAAIRNFLRDQSDWQNPARQISVVLAGDATYDPFNYGGVANGQFVAPWMDEVDPYARGIGADFGEAACDACIAQLNGDNPLVGDNLSDGRQWFSADVWIGRFPVRSEQETADLAAKLVTYDTAPEGGTWRLRNIFLADNYIKKLDDQLNADLDFAGDFAALSDNVIRMLAVPAAARRIYFDPAPNREVLIENNSIQPAPNRPGYYLTQPRSVVETWRISDVVNASGTQKVTLPINSLVIGSLSGGAGLVAYNGHSNHWQFAKTEDRDSAPDPKWLLNINDVRLLANYNKPFMMLSMTCYTSQFVKPANNGTLDEVLLRATNAGAVAVWGPTGLSVVSGHELLQEGFLAQLHKQKSGSQRLGALIAAGYTAVLEDNVDLDPVMTFVLLGDPLTRARFGDTGLYMPTIRR